MECGICSRAFGEQRQPTCPSCARATIYELRYEQLTSLISKEQSHERVSTLILPPADLSALNLEGPELVEVTESVRKLEVEQQRLQIEGIEQRLHDIRGQQGILRDQIRQAREDNQARGDDYKQKHSIVGAQAQELNQRKPLLVDPLKTEMKRLDHKLGKVYNRTTEGRQKLCEETARLAGLKQRRRRASDGSVSDDYIIGQVNMMDLRDLNTAHPDHVTACLGNVCRLLMTCSHYLSIRLPAEIILPRTDFPHPSIMSLQASYQDKDSAPHPTHGFFSSPASSRHLPGKSKPKLRLLYLDRPLPHLAKEDPATYNLFIEGIVLLAWNIAWLCRSQGVTLGEDWEHVCDMGRNLFQLFLADHPEGTEKQKRSSQPATGTSTPSQEASTPRFGDFSHASSHKNLAGPEGTEWMRTWRIPSLARIIDKVKSHLLTEMSGAEWELLDEQEWNEEREDEQAVLVGGANPPSESRIGMSLMTAVDETESRRGGSGWTKVKSRSGDVV